MPEIMVNTLLWFIHERMQLLRLDVLVKSIFNYYDADTVEKKLLFMSMFLRSKSQIYPGKNKGKALTKLKIILRT